MQGQQLTAAAEGKRANYRVAVAPGPTNLSMLAATARRILANARPSFAPSGVDVIAHASSRKIAFGVVRSTVFISRRANWETR